MTKKYDLYNYQEKAVNALLGGKRIIYAGMGLGKCPLSVVWAKKKCDETGKKKILIISTPSKALHTQDFQQAFDDFVGDGYRDSLEALDLTSWHQLHKWVDSHRRDLRDWVVIADEIARIKGHTSRMARNFLTITKVNNDWSGYTGTPGDRWMDFAAYFQACGYIRNKTEFKTKFCQIQTFKGYPEIVGYNNEKTLKKWWDTISYAPDTKEIESTIPKENYELVKVAKPRGYDKVIKLRQHMLENGEFKPDPDYEDIIQNPSAMTHYLRQLCFTKEKQQWLKDYLTDLGEPVVIFYHYTNTTQIAEKITHNVLPGTRIWRIDGSHHEIPTAETIGPRDVVLAQWQSGGEALNLQFLRNWVALEPTYSWSTHKQAKGRVRRIGQTRPIFYKMLIATDTIEERVLKCLREKRDFSVQVWWGEQKLIKEKE